MVLILERIVLNCREMGGSQEERAPLIHDNRNGHGAASSPDLESSGQHVHVDFQAHSPFRSFMLFLSLSLHSVFEGLAIGLQSTDSKVRKEKVLYLMLNLLKVPENIWYLLISPLSFSFFVFKLCNLTLPLWFFMHEEHVLPFVPEKCWTNKGSLRFSVYGFRTLWQERNLAVMTIKSMSSSHKTVFK